MKARDLLLRLKTNLFALKGRFYRYSKLPFDAKEDTYGKEVIPKILALKYILTYFDGKPHAKKSTSQSIASFVQRSCLPFSQTKRE